MDSPTDRASRRRQPDLRAFDKGLDEYVAAYQQARANDDFPYRVWALWGLIARGQESVAWCRRALASGDDEVVEDAASVLAWIGIPEDVVPTIRQRLRAAPEDSELADALAWALSTDRQRGERTLAGRRPLTPRAQVAPSLWDRYRPVTDRVGYLECTLDSAVQALVEWRVRLHGLGKVRTRRLLGTLPELLRHLEPLVVGAEPRELWVETRSRWTAYFDCGALGNDPWPPISYLCEHTECGGVCITSVPHTIGKPGYRSGRYGSTQFELLGLRQLSSNSRSSTIRSIEATYDTRWRFETAGKIQPFEEVTRYQARYARDRFTHEMLERYCRALGIAAFDPSFYGPNAVLVESDVVMPPAPRFLSIEEAQTERDVFPG